MIKLKLLRWGGYPGLRRWALNAIKVSLWEGEGYLTTDRRRWCALKVEEGATGQGIQVVTRS